MLSRNQLRFIRKALIVLALSMVFNAMVQANDAPTPKRAQSIEKKFGLVYNTTDQGVWLFMFRPTHMPHGIPVVMPVNASDHEAFVALQASMNCAIFYEFLIQTIKEKSDPAFHQSGY